MNGSLPSQTNKARKLAKPHPEMIEGPLANERFKKALLLLLVGLVFSLSVPAQTPSPLRVLKMTSKLENDPYFASLSGTWLSIEVQNISDKAIKMFSARVEIVDEMHERIFDTVKLQFARESLIPRHLESGKRLTFESRLGDYKMPSDWEYGKTFDSAWVSRHVKILSVTFKDGSVWTAEPDKN